MTFQVTLINSKKYGVVGHAAGCAHIKKDPTKDHEDKPWTLTVQNKREAFLEYNVDFIEVDDESNAWDIHWMSCANHVPDAEFEGRTPKGELAAEMDAEETARDGVKPMSKTEAYAQVKAMRESLRWAEQAIERGDLNGVVVNAEVLRDRASSFASAAQNEGINKVN
jgi:hypothetical protein